MTLSLCWLVTEVCTTVASQTRQQPYPKCKSSGLLPSARGRKTQSWKKCWCSLMSYECCCRCQNVVCDDRHSFCKRGHMKYPIIHIYTTVQCNIAVIARFESLTRLESGFFRNGSTRVTINDSTPGSEPFSQNLQTSDSQILFVCTQRNEPFLLQWWSILVQIFCFDRLLVVLWCISSIGQWAQISSDNTA